MERVCTFMAYLHKVIEGQVIVQKFSRNKFQTVTFKKRTEELVALLKNLKKDNDSNQYEAFHVPAFFQNPAYRYIQSSLRCYMARMIGHLKRSIASNIINSCNTVS